MIRPIHTRRPIAALLLLVATLVASCSMFGGPSASPPGRALTTAELKYKLIDTFGPLWFCDPDFYPIARQDEAKRAIERFGEVQADSDAFDAIVAHLGFDPGADFTADQKLAIYRAWKQLNGTFLDVVGDGPYPFEYLNMPAAGATEGRRTTGTIDRFGSITIKEQAPAGQPPCPICVARGTRIATPGPDVAVEDVRVGMRIWSVDARGERIVVSVIKTGRTPVPDSHEVVRLALGDGRVVRASPGHPLADGRLLGSIRRGDTVDGAEVMSAALERYDGGWTFDLLPDGPTGLYFADGVLLGSTLVTVSSRCVAVLEERGPPSNP